MTDWIEKHYQEQREKLGQKGGPGSGHHGHAGRPGKVGGSAPGKSTAISIHYGGTPASTYEAAAPDDEAWVNFSQEWLDTLDVQEVKALKKYRGAGSFYMNKILRTPVAMEEVTPELDAITATLDRSVTPKDVTVFRGFGGERTGNAMAGLKPGTIITDKGFVSTSINETYALKEFKSRGEIAGARIHVPKGTKAAYITDLGSLQTEWELLIQRGADFKVMGYSKIGDDTVIDLELLGTRPREFFRTDEEYWDYEDQQETKAAKPSRFQWVLEDIIIQDQEAE